MTTPEENTTITEGTVELLTRLRTCGPMTRSDIATATGWARPTVNKRIDELVSIGLASPLAIPSPTGGRPAQGFAFVPSAACILTVDIATTTTTVALCDLSGAPAHVRTIECGAEGDPDNVLEAIRDTADGMMRDAAPCRLCAVSIAVTTRVEEQTGNIIQAPVMRRWENHNLRGHFTSLYHVPAFVENDANVRALYKAHQLASEKGRIVNDLIYVHAGMGLGAGIISSGSIMHGAFGAAGDIGHIHVFGDSGEDHPCRCGNTGCVEAYAGGWAIIQALCGEGKDVKTMTDVVDLVSNGDVEAIRLVRRAGRLIGDVLSASVNLLNPACIVIGGELSRCGELLMSGIRERIWGRAQPLATKSLMIEACPDDVHAGIIGLAYAAIEQGLTSVGFVQGLSQCR